MNIMEGIQQTTADLYGSLRMPSFLELILYGMLCFPLFLVLLDLHLRRKMGRRKLADPKNDSSMPEVIPFTDPLKYLGKHFHAIYKGDAAKLRHPKYFVESNMKSEEGNQGCQCRQMCFIGHPVVVSWNPDHFREVVADTENYGKVTGFSKGFDDMSKKSIMMVEGQEWKDQKRLIHPAFQFTHVKNQIPKFNEIARRFTSQLGALDGPVEMLPWTSKATLDGLSLAGFGLDMGALLDKNTEAYEVYTQTLARIENPLAGLPYYDSLPLESNKKWFESKRLYLQYLSDLVGEKRLRLLEEQRMGQEREGKDILDLLIAARDEDENIGLTDEELIHNVNIFFIAGHETTSSTVAFATHMLAEHPDIQDRLYEEIQNVVGDQDPSNDDFTSLKLTGYFLKEVLRMYPPAIGSVRKIKKDMVLGGYEMVEGGYIVLSPFTTHHHPAYWERPNDFWPERFLPENSKGRHPFAYLPFSAGPRACIGKQFALVEMKILLVHLIQNFKVLKNPEAKTPFTDALGIVLRPAKGASVILEKRK